MIHIVLPTTTTLISRFYWPFQGNSPVVRYKISVTESLLFHVIVVNFSRKIRRQENPLGITTSESPGESL